MSLYHVECVRVDGTIKAYVKIQNDFTGQIRDSIKCIYLDGNRYYITADGMKHTVNQQRDQLLQREAEIKEALRWYKETAWNRRF